VTYQDTLGREASDRPATLPANEIAITSEMIGAGIVALAEGDTAFEMTEEIVARVYRVMEEASPLNAAL
jgi:hypothetical protein